MEKKFFVEGKNGKIACVQHSPSSTVPAPLVLVIHGFRSSKDSPKISFLSKRIAAAGFHAIRFDFFGHGESDGNYSDVTISKMQQNISDVMDHSKAISLANSSKIGLVGSSIGGYNALLFSANHSQKHVDTSRAVHSIISIASSAGIGERTLHHYETTESEWKRNGVVSFQRHGKTFQLKYDFYREAKSIPFIETIRHLNVPTLLIHGTLDENTPFSEAELLFEALPGPKRLLRMEGSGHDFANPLELEQISNATVDWLKQYLK